MRVNGEIVYELEHGEGYAGVISRWSVPYSAWLRRGQIEELEADGMATLVSLALKVGPIRRPLEDPHPDELRHWQEAWRQNTKYCEAELQELFATDCQERHWLQNIPRAA